MCWELRIDINGRGAWLAANHSRILKDLNHVLPLGEEETQTYVLNMHTQISYEECQDPSKGTPVEGH
jgi:hypothetical protein